MDVALGFGFYPLVSNALQSKHSPLRSSVLHSDVVRNHTFRLCLVPEKCWGKETKYYEKSFS